MAEKDPRIIYHKPNTGFQVSKILALKLEPKSHLANQHVGKGIWPFLYTPDLGRALSGPVSTARGWGEPPKPRKLYPLYNPVCPWE